MIKAFLIYFILLFSISDFGVRKVPPGLLTTDLTINKDSLERQILFNGRIWQNQFYNTEGDQFFLSSDFSNGSVGVDDYNFTNVKIRYDLFNDELLVQRNDGTVIQLNKEMIKSFNLLYYEKKYSFINFDIASSDALDGYYQLLYDGDIKIYVKYLKDLIPTTITNGLPKFSQVNRIFINKDGKIHRTDNRKDLLSLFAEGEEQVLIKKYIRSNRIVISKKDPESYRRVIEYYETKSK